MSATPRYALPYILPGQAQKELFHNEALLRIDLAIQPAAEGVAAVPPPAPAEGACWIVADGAAGAWAGHAGELALWTEFGWRFLAAQEGMTVWSKADGVALRRTGGAWSGGEISCSALLVGGEQVVGPRQPAVPSPSGGTVIDAEARAALDALIVALMSHGLID